MKNVKVIMITAFHDMETTINAMKGAFDYIHKPVNVDELDLAIKKALKSLEMEKKLTGCWDVSRRAVSGWETSSAPATRCGNFQNDQHRIPKPNDGADSWRKRTGKELIAKVIHNNTSPNEPFIAVNCSAIVETLLESELFGHEKGSFISAVARKLGKFELAWFGSVFLDEISEMSVNLQAKLLRVLQEMEFERVGGKDRVKVNARIMAATNKDLRAMVKEGKFRGMTCFTV